MTLQRGDRAERVLSLLSRSRLECVIARAPISDVESLGLLERCGFELKDVRVHLDLDLSAFIPPSPLSSNQITKYNGEGLDELRMISGKSFWSTHFHLDDRFDKRKVSKMYEVWVDKAVREGYSILLAKRNRKLNGFLAARKSGDEYYIELVAVSQHLQGRGIGHDLIVEGLNDARKEFKKATIGVQLGNIPAIRLYEKLGFRIYSSEGTFHWWMT